MHYNENSPNEESNDSLPETLPQSAPNESSQSYSNEQSNNENVSNETNKETQDTNEETKEPETPEWFMKDKYKSVEEQAKSAFELQKKMGKYWGSPQDDYSVEGVEGVDTADPLVQALSPALKEMGISQEGFKHLVTQYMEANKQMMQTLENDLKTKLTTEDAHTYQAINKWMSDNLTPQEADTIKNNWLMSAEDFKLFNHLRLMAAPTTNVPNVPGNTPRFESSKEVENDKIKYRKEVKAGARVADKNYENSLASRYRDAVAREIRARNR